MGKGVKQGPSILEQSRDIYGFAVRPQHLQRYREYASIYQEEEAERAERWELFLRTYCQHGQAVLASSTGTCTGQNFENGSQKLDSANSLPGSRDLTKNEVDLVGRPDYNDAGKQPNGNHRTVQTWSSVRPSLKILGQALNNQLENSLYFNERKSSVVTEVESELFTESGDKKVNVLNSGPIHNVIEEKFNKALSEAESVKSECVDFSIPGNQINDKEFAKEKTASVCFPEQSLSEEVHRLVSAESNLKEESSVPEEVSAARDELKFLVRGGVPMALRGELWQVFVGTAARRIEGHYDVLLNGSIDVGSSTSGVIEKWTSQIEKDLPRTFPGHPALDKDGRNALRRLLTAYARYNPDVGYCQAMNFFAALLLLLMPEENAFWTLTCIIDDYFEGYFTERMLEAQVDQLVLQELVREYFPKLMTHLEALGVQVAWISGPWFLSIFVNMLPWESVLRVWDVLLFEGNRCMLFYTALALMELHAPFIMAAHDVGDALSLLQSRTASTFDSSQLVLMACMGFQEVDEAKVDALRLKHRPQVLANIDERAMELHLRKNSQDSISKKFSQTVINEPTAEDNNTHSHSNKFEKKEGLPDSLSECAELNGTLHFDSIHANTGVPLQIALKDTECDLKKQVLWLQGELQRVLKEKKNALSRAEELETALMELVKEDNRRLLSAKLEKLEEEVAALSQALLEKQVQEEAFLQTISRLEQEQAICKDAQRSAEQDAAAQRYVANLLQEKYEEAAEALEKMEQRAIMAESVLEATIQYQAMDGAHATHRGVVLSSTRGDHLSKANCHLKPNSTEPHPQGKHDPGDLACDPNLRSANSNYDQFEEPATRKQGMFSRAFGLNWGDRSKVH